jgi:hypothetical protein
MLKQDLLVWKKFAMEAATGLPLYALPEAPLLSPLRFISDAAGAAYRWEFGVKQNLSVQGDRRAASVGYNEAGPVFLTTIKWLDWLLTVAKGTNGTSFGSHRLTTPVLSNPRELRGEHIILEVDNLGVVFGWEKRMTKGDVEVSILLRALNLIEAFLHCKIYIQHVPRVSNAMASLADALTRESMTGPAERALLDQLEVQRGLAVGTGTRLVPWEPNVK